MINFRNIFVFLMFFHKKKKLKIYLKKKNMKLSKLEMLLLSLYIEINSFPHEIKEFSFL